MRRMALRRRRPQQVPGGRLQFSSWPWQARPLAAASASAGTNAAVIEMLCSPFEEAQHGHVVLIDDGGRSFQPVGRLAIRGAMAGAGTPDGWASTPRRRRSMLGGLGHGNGAAAIGSLQQFALLERGGRGRQAFASRRWLRRSPCTSPAVVAIEASPCLLAETGCGAASAGHQTSFFNARVEGFQGCSIFARRMTILLALNQDDHQHGGPAAEVEQAGIGGLGSTFEQPSSFSPDQGDQPSPDQAVVRERHRGVDGAGREANCPGRSGSWSRLVTSARGPADRWRRQWPPLTLVLFACAGARADENR